MVRDTDVEYGLELCDLANKYNEKPQGWYNWPLIIYYSRIGNYKKSLEHSIAGNFKDDNNIAQTSTLYWLNGEKEAALKRYTEVKKLIIATIQLRITSDFLWKYMTIKE